MSLLFRYHNKWIWESTVYSWLVIIAFVFAVSLYFFLQLDFVGLISLLFLIPVYVLFNSYQKINKMIVVLKGCISAQNGEVAASLLYFKNKSIPGIAILRNDVIILIPVFGRRHKIFFDKIEVIKEVNKIPGKWLLGKRVFKIEFKEKPSVLFAVPDSVGNRWVVFLKKVSIIRSS